MKVNKHRKRAVEGGQQPKGQRLGDETFLFELQAYKEVELIPYGDRGNIA